MDPHWGLSCLSLLCLLTLAPGQRDFDLADALDDPEPTKKPSSDGHPRPKPPYPQPESPGHGGGIYPRLKPQPRPQPENNNHGGHWNNEDEGYHPPRPKPPAEPANKERVNPSSCDLCPEAGHGWAPRRA